MPATTTSYRSQAEAAKDIRIGLWGDVPFAQRPCLLPEHFVRGEQPPTYSIVVSANVNGRLVAFGFDNYGRRTQTLVLSKVGSG